MRFATNSTPIAAKHPLFAFFHGLAHNVLMSFIKKNTLFVLLALLSTSAFAKVFQTQFIKFTLPPNWSCRQEELDWVCQPDNAAERSEVILIVVTKAVNEVDDNFPKYESVLKTPKDMRDLLGNAYKSDIKYVRKRDLKGHPWMDSLHRGSEIPGFYTRYVASIREKVAGLITYSIAESTYPKWSPIMDSLVDSAEIFFDPKAFAEAMNTRPGSLLASRNGVKGRAGPELEVDLNKSGGAAGGQADKTQIIGGLFLAAAIAYFIWKRKQKR